MRPSFFSCLVLWFIHFILWFGFFVKTHKHSSHTFLWAQCLYIHPKQWRRNLESITSRTHYLHIFTHRRTTHIRVPVCALINLAYKTFGTGSIQSPPHTHIRPVMKTTSRHKLVTHCGAAVGVIVPAQIKRIDLTENVKLTDFYLT